jgi:predicted Zn-dependent peptidase
MVTLNHSHHQHRFENGLTLLAEPMPWLRSASFSILLPAGNQYDPANRLGLASCCCDMIQRGSGERDSRRFIEDLELLGVDYGFSVTVYHTSMGGTVPAQNIGDALAIFADVVRNPWLPEDQLEDARLVCYQEIRGIEDDLAQKALVALRLKHYGRPLGYNSSGTEEGVAAIQIDDVRRFCLSNYRPDETIIAVAGKFDWSELRDRVGELFGGIPRGETEPVIGLPGEHGTLHIPYESNQTHICLAYPSVTYGDPEYFRARGAIGVMSDGMSSRLFHEVREKRGLCYTVFATLHSLLDRGSVMCYAGTGAERAQETLDVILREFRRLSEGVSADELSRLKVQIRSHLIMQQESSRSRASSIAGDWFYLGRVRPLDE